MVKPVFCIVDTGFCSSTDFQLMRSSYYSIHFQLLCGHPILKEPNTNKSDRVFQLYHVTRQTNGLVVYINRKYIEFLKLVNLHLIETQRKPSVSLCCTQFKEFIVRLLLIFWRLNGRCLITTVSKSLEN